MRIRTVESVEIERRSLSFSSAPKNRFPLLERFNLVVLKKKSILNETKIRRFRQPSGEDSCRCSTLKRHDVERPGAYDKATPIVNHPDPTRAVQQKSV